VRDRPVLEGIASSLTELFAPAIHQARIAGFVKNYAFANDSTLSYFRRRVDEAPRDVKFGLAYVLDHAMTEADQRACLAALRFNTNPR